MHIERHRCTCGILRSGEKERRRGDRLLLGAAAADGAVGGVSGGALDGVLGRALPWCTGRLP